MFTFSCKNSSSTKLTSSSFFLWVINQLKMITSFCSTVDKLPWLPECFHPYWEIPSKKGKYPMLRTNAKLHQLIKHAEISYSIVSLVFHKFSYRTYWNGLNQVPKAEVLRVPQKVQNMLVWYLLSGIHVLVYSCTGCGNSKIHLSHKDKRSSFSRVSLKSENKDAHP